MKTNHTVRDLLPAEVEPVRLFLGQHGWGHRTGSSDYFAQPLENSQRTALALSGEQIIGFARGITDGLSNGYLSMVVVDDQHRRAGVGRALVEHVMGDNPEITWVLRAGREGAEAFFSSLGFETSVIAMERRRLKKPAPTMATTMIHLLFQARTPIDANDSAKHPTVGLCGFPGTGLFRDQGSHAQPQEPFINAGHTASVDSLVSLSINLTLNPALSLSCWIGALLLGGVTAWLMFSVQYVTLDDSQTGLILPGTWKVLMLYLLFFAVNYYFGYQDDVHPEQASAPDMLLFKAATSGFVCGLIGTRSLKYYRLLRLLQAQRAGLTAQ